MDNCFYEKTSLNTISRHKERGRYDKETIASIVREAKILHVAFVDDDGMPQCVPMIGALEDDAAGDHVLYLHGHPSSRIVKLLSQPNVRIVATATILDEYVLALSSFNSSMNYRSAVLHGYTVPIGTQPGDDPEKAKTEAFAHVTERTIPGRWDHSRKPTPSEFKGTAIIRVVVDSASSKIRKGFPVDDKEDIENTELTSTIWTGIIPVRKVTGPPQPSEYCPRGPPPEHVRELAQIGTE